ncbi:MAG: hypothetical protein IH914_05505 [candidate division Zixibacteria bacterium]|nr:hypothetical protein [candidate division Zixibacteria bacterium]
MKIADIGIEALRSLGDVTGIDTSVIVSVIQSATEFILGQFGEPGLYAAYIALASIAIVALGKLLKLSFAILKFVALPSVALAFVASIFLPQNFMYFLPVTVSLSSVFLLFRS